MISYCRARGAPATARQEVPIVLIILSLYVVALWLVFSNFKIVRWGWLSGTISLSIGAFILATFLREWAAAFA